MNKTSANKTPARSRKTGVGDTAASAAAIEVEIEIVVESPLWERESASEDTLQRAVRAAAESSTRAGELAILLTDDARMRVLNREWRGIDKTTNVLSFPGGAKNGPHLGDIAIAYETVAAEALAEGKPFHHHLAHLGVHGFLHLIGYDHETDADAEVMEARERAILQDLAIPDPYAVADENEGR